MTENYLTLGPEFGREKDYGRACGPEPNEKKMPALLTRPASPAGGRICRGHFTRSSLTNHRFAKNPLDLEVKISVAGGGAGQRDMLFDVAPGPVGVPFAPKLAERPREVGRHSKALPAFR